MTTKPCSACSQELPQEAYSDFQFKKKKDRRCKECITAASREKRKRVKEKVPPVKKKRTKPGGGPVDMFGYDTLAVEEMLQNIFDQVQANNTSIKIDWVKIAASQTTCPMTSRECQLLWRHLAYRKDDITTDVKGSHQLQAQDEVEADESDIDAPFKPDYCFLPPVPAVGKEESEEKHQSEPPSSESLPSPLLSSSSSSSSRETALGADLHLNTSNEQIVRNDASSSQQNVSHPLEISMSALSNHDLPSSSSEISSSFIPESSSSKFAPFRSDSSPFFSPNFPSSTSTHSPTNSPGSSWAGAFALPSASLSSPDSVEKPAYLPQMNPSLPPALAVSANGSGLSSFSPSIYSSSSPWTRAPMSSSSANSTDFRFNGSQPYPNLTNFSSSPPFSSITERLQDRSLYSQFSSAHSR